MKRLSKPMETMIKGATEHHVRVDGEIVRSGYIVFGSTNTIVALMERGVCTPAMSAMEGNYGFHWLTDDGLSIRASLVYDDMSDADRIAEDARISAREAAIVADNVAMSEDHPAVSDTITDVPSIAELTTRDLLDGSEAAEARISARLADVMALYPFPMEAADFDRMNADLEGADIEGENAREIAAEREEAMEQMRADASDCDDCKGDHDTIVTCRIHRNVHAYSEHIDSLMLSELEASKLDPDATIEVGQHRLDAEKIIERVITADDVMVRLPRGNLVSMAYLNTMRRIHADSLVRYDAWKTKQYAVIADTPNLFALIDGVLEAGKISFGYADREKRRIRNITRPKLGSKRKPSKNRR